MIDPLLSQHKHMHDIPRPQPQLLPQHLVPHAPDAELGDGRAQPRLEDVRRPLLLRDNADRGVLRLRLRLLLLLLRPPPPPPQAADVGAGADEGGDEGLVVDAVAGDEHVEAGEVIRVFVFVLGLFFDRHGLFERRGHVVEFPVEGCECDVVVRRSRVALAISVAVAVVSPATSAPALRLLLLSVLTIGIVVPRLMTIRRRGVRIQILPQQPMHVLLVREDVAAHGRGQGQGDEARDAAAELDDGRGGREDGGGPEGIGIVAI